MAGEFKFELQVTELGEPEKQRTNYPPYEVTVTPSRRVTVIALTREEFDAVRVAVLAAMKGTEIHIS